MTTYILHGGMTSKETGDNKEFFRTFTDIVKKDKVSILLCYFAQPKSNWDKKFQRDKESIEKQTTKQITLSIAEDEDDLLKKIAFHDVIYVAGGSDELIEPTLANLHDLGKFLEDKIYIGSSMGAFIVSANYVLSFDADQDISRPHKGLGLLPINTLCHWNVETKKEYKVSLLKKVAPDKPIVVINEYAYTTIIY
jgi:peptidase E